MLHATHQVLGTEFDHNATPRHALEVLDGSELGDPAFVSSLGSLDEWRALDVARDQAATAFELGDPADLFAFRRAAANILIHINKDTYSGD